MTAAAAATNNQLLDRECFVCHQPIRVQRDSVNNKWLKFDLDGSEHIDRQQVRPRVSNSELLEKLNAISAQIDVLTALIRSTKA